MPDLHRQLLLVPAFVCLAASALAQGPKFDYPADPDFVVLEYSEGSATLAPEETPRLRLYGDGRLAVHYPDTMRRAGDWEARLTQGEIRSLLASLEAHGVLGFDAADTKQRRQESERARRQREGTVVSVSDDSFMAITLQLRGYTPTTGKSVSDLHRSVEWRNVQQDAQWYPDVAALRGLAAAERVVRELLEREELVKDRRGSLEVRE